VGEPQVKGFFVRETNGAVNPGPGAFTELSASGTLTAESLLDISGSSSGQIKFPATQNASANANTLDDYEEGTFTPGITFGGGSTGMTFSTQYGKSTKIGNVVFATGRIVLTAKGSSTGIALITGLPYTSNADTDYRAVAGVFAFNLATAGAGVFDGAVINNSTTITLTIDSSTGGNNINADDGDFNNNSVIHFSVMYHV
jgi:hypothetical protein